MLTECPQTHHSRIRKVLETLTSYQDKLFHINNTRVSTSPTTELSGTDAIRAENLKKIYGMRYHA